MNKQVTINEVIKGFGNGETEGKSYSVRIEGNRLYSYETVIAIRVGYNQYILNTYKYSTTTSRHQNKVKLYCNVIETFDNEEELIKGGQQYESK